MKKEDLLKITTNYLEKYNKTAHEHIMEEDSKLFLSSLNEINYNQIKSLLSVKPEFSNILNKKNGRHSIHYACLTNNINKVSIITNTAIRNGLTHWPVLNEKFKKAPKNSNILEFCCRNDLDQSFAKLLEYYENPQEIDFEIFLKLALIDGNKKTFDLIQNLIPQEKKQDILLNIFASTFISEDDSRIGSNYFIVKNSFDFNIEKAKNYGIDLTFNNEKNSNYLNLFLHYAVKNIDFYIQSGNSNDYDKDIALEKSSFAKFNKVISTLVIKYKQDWYKKDSINMSPNDYYLKIIAAFSNYSQETVNRNQLNEFLITMRKHSMNNSLSNNNSNNKETQKLKI